MLKRSWGQGTTLLPLTFHLTAHKQHNSHSFSEKMVPSPFAGNTKDKKAGRKECTIMCWDCTILLLFCVTFVIRCLVGWYPSGPTEMLNNPGAINKSYLSSKARLSPAVEDRMVGLCILHSMHRRNFKGPGSIPHKTAVDSCWFGTSFTIHSKRKEHQWEMLHFAMVQQRANYYFLKNNTVFW